MSSSTLSSSPETRKDVAKFSLSGDVSSTLSSSPETWVCQVDEIKALLEGLPHYLVLLKPPFLVWQTLKSGEGFHTI